jgi:hypothetical protein
MNNEDTGRYLNQEFRLISCLERLSSWKEILSDIRKLIEYSARYNQEGRKDQ